MERFSKEFAPLVTSGPPGVTGYTTGRPAVREVFAYWPALIPKHLVSPEVRIASVNEQMIPLSTIAHGRSGDKGNHANIAMIAYTAAGFAWLREHLTADVVASYFALLDPSEVVRYEAHNLWRSISCFTMSLAGGAASRCAPTRRARRLLWPCCKCR